MDFYTWLLLKGTIGCIPLGGYETGGERFVLRSVAGRKHIIECQRANAVLGRGKPMRLMGTTSGLPLAPCGARFPIGATNVSPTITILRSATGVDSGHSC